MAENEQGEDPNDAGYLLHELQNANINDHDDDLEAEQREIMPDAAYLRENIEEEIEIEEIDRGKIGRGHQIWRQPERIRRTLNDNRETFGPTGTKIYHNSINWTNQPLGDAVYNLYQPIFGEFTKWTNVNIQKSIKILTDKNEPIKNFMSEVTENEIKQYFGTHLTQTLFKGHHMRLREWLDKLPKTMAAWDRPDCYWLKRERFDWIRTNLDCGENVKVNKLDKKGNVIYSNRRDTVSGERIPRKVLCLTSKFESLYSIFNTVSIQLREPTDNMIALDESMRPSFSCKDDCKVYMPNKPIKDWILFDLFFQMPFTLF